jgi:hypothetical protein
MTYQEAISLAERQIYRKQREIENLQGCINYLKNESLSNDKLTQSPEKILSNFGCELPNI